MGLRNYYNSILVYGVRLASVRGLHTNCVLCLEISEVRKNCPASCNIRVVFHFSVCCVRPQICPDVFWFHLVSISTVGAY